ncbi:MAG: protein phosphatase 2C family protein [Patescibacteria group bacterium]|nr:protein phosphatase 2C family protein [Patescibacteria group bacterium]
MKKWGTVTTAQEQGPRSHQEDRFDEILVGIDGDPYGCLLVVMDGHSGFEAVDLCAKELQNLFVPRPFDEGEESLRDLVGKLDRLTRSCESGTTFSAALIMRSETRKMCRATIAILGDSPVMVVRKLNRVWLSPEHNVRSNLAEREAAIRRGGFCENGYLFQERSDLANGLQMSRALGDRELSHVLCREPEIFTIDDPQWVLVASDGISDPNHEEAGFPFVKMGSRWNRDCATAERVMKWRVRRGLRDNATAVVWNAPNK